MTNLEFCCCLTRAHFISLTILFLSLGTFACKEQRHGQSFVTTVVTKKTIRAKKAELPATGHSFRLVRKQNGDVDPEIEQIGLLLMNGRISLFDFMNQHSGQPPSTKFLLWLLDRDPTLACRLVEAAPNVRAKMNARNALAQAWGRKNPLKCLDWIDSLALNPVQRIALQQSMVYQAPIQLANDGDPATWFAILNGLKHADDGGGKLARFLEVEIARSLGNRLGAANGLDILERSGGEVSQASINITISAAAEINLPETQTYLESHPDTYAEWLSSGGAVQMARQMTSTSPKDALIWASGLASAKISEKAVAEVMMTWLPISSEDASREINDMKKGTLKDAAIMAMASWLNCAGSKQEITPWIDEVASPAARQKLEELSR